MAEPRAPTAAPAAPPVAAVIGLGQMGAGIARNLADRHRLAAGWDIRREARQGAGLAPALLAADAADAVARAGVLLFALPQTEDIAAFLDETPPQAGQVVVDLTTSHPKAGRDLAARLAAQGVRYLDAAMTGGAQGADAGRLTLMVGGEAGDLGAVAPILDSFAARVFHLGPAGAGQAMKLVHNLILHTAFLATCEGLRLAERAGIDPHRAVEVLNAGNARSFVTETRFPRDILSGRMQARSRIANLEKDVGLALDLAAELGASAALGTRARAILARALNDGHGETDFAWLYPLYDELVSRLEEQP